MKAVSLTPPSCTLNCDMFLICASCLAGARCILRGYNTALRRHHSKLAQRLIGAGIWGAPSRKHFISLLSADAAHVEAMLAQLRLCFVPVVKRLHAFLVLRNLETRDAFD
uniref:Uncharacterized protein n=1 Tax=Chrysotila carterae TaxID=13221 RepID=A0A7S4BLN2_CHRCT